MVKLGNESCQGGENGDYWTASPNVARDSRQETWHEPTSKLRSIDDGMSRNGVRRRRARRLSLWSSRPEARIWRNNDNARLAVGPAHSKGVRSVSDASPPSYAAANVNGRFFLLAKSPNRLYPERVCPRAAFNSAAKMHSQKTILAFTMPNRQDPIKSRRWMCNLNRCRFR